MQFFIHCNFFCQKCKSYLLTYCFKRSHKDTHEDINALSQNVTKISFFFPWHVSQSSEVGVSKPYVYFLLMNTITIVSCFT